ncbi:VOC family protein [Puniceicoccaceae bacterium K14]|nr:VOC family protein [Puniceicoccaceae bacterium K14]
MPNSSHQNLFQISILVKEYDEAIHHYCNVLGFTLLEDTDLGNGKRWVRVAPSNQGCSLLLARAKNEKERQAIGNQSGGRVFLFLHTNDFWNYYDSLMKNNINFLEKPRKESYGTVVVFQDLYGNKWDLIEPKEEKPNPPNSE